MNNEESSHIEDRIEKLEKRVAILEQKLNSKGKRGAKAKLKTNTWYKPGSTIGKIVLLIEEGFFDTPHTMSEIIFELKEKDYHLKPSDLTFPMRRIVRNGLLKRTKKKTDGTLSKKWLYVRV